MSRLIEGAKQLDSNHPLNELQYHFSKPTGVIYFDGNSLGMMPKQTGEYLQSVIQSQWGNRLIRSWNEAWYNLPRSLGNKLANLLGASEGEVILSDSTSINLFKLSTALLQQQDDKVILIDDLNFPTDIYLQEGISNLLNKHKVRLIQSDGVSISYNQIEEQLRHQEVGLLVLSHVAFKSGCRYPLKEVTKLANRYGVPLIWDLSHSAGVVPIDLHEAGVQYAVGCTYKYLNGGPGSPAFLFIRKEKQPDIQSPIWGWFGDEYPFEFRTSYQPAPTIDQFLVGTPPILSLSALLPSLQLFESVSIDELWQKSQELSEYFIELVNQELSSHGFEILSPLNQNERGSHVTLSHPNASQICQALIDEQYGDYAIIPDFRAPQFIRFGFAPFYNTFHEIALCIKQLKDIMETNHFASYPTHIEGVT